MGEKAIKITYQIGAAEQMQIAAVTLLQAMYLGRGIFALMFFALNPGYWGLFLNGDSPLEVWIEDLSRATKNSLIGTLIFVIAMYLVKYRQLSALRGSVSLSLEEGWLKIGRFSYACSSIRKIGIYLGLVVIQIWKDEKNCLWVMVPVKTLGKREKAGEFCRAIRNMLREEEQAKTKEISEDGQKEK